MLLIKQATVEAHLTNTSSIHPVTRADLTWSGVSEAADWEYMAVIVNDRLTFYEIIISTR